MRRWLRQRQAWQWWHQQQVLQLHQQAESIRDGLLQQTFAFRRYLESTVSAQPEAKQTARWLEQFQEFYLSLESLSNELSPPFVADSLPLALQFALKDWQRSHLELDLQLNLPTDWSDNSPHKNQIILSMVTELLTLLTPEGNRAERLHLTLTNHSNFYKLTFQLEDVDSLMMLKIVRRSEVTYIKEIFHSLAAGQLEISHKGAVLITQLCWRDD
ncbi:MAG: hypothetical protein F6K58_11955 [Symploca sp. SIO2E9]|nr:hypothetical protein [Symploca sp. SIO2E9]